MAERSNPDELTTLTHEIRRMREDLRAIVAGEGNAAPGLAVADTDTGGFPVLRPARMRRRAIRKALGL